MTWRLMIFGFQGRRHDQAGNVGRATVERQKGLFSPGPLYVGLASISLENREDMGSVYERVAFNMRERDIPGTFYHPAIPDPFPMDEEFVISRR